MSVKHRIHYSITVLYFNAVRTIEKKIKCERTDGHLENIIIVASESNGKSRYFTRLVLKLIRNKIETYSKFNMATKYIWLVKYTNVCYYFTTNSKTKRYARFYLK